MISERSTDPVRVLPVQPGGPAASTTLSLTVLKWIALWAMIVDHTGLFAFGDYLPMRYVGRLAMPLFAFAVSQGVMHTRSLGSYVIRLWVVALLSLPLHGEMVAAVGGHGHTIVLGFALYATAHWCARRDQSPLLSWMLSALVLVALLRVEYGALTLLIPLVLSYTPARSWTQRRWIMLLALVDQWPLVLITVFGYATVPLLLESVHMVLWPVSLVLIERYRGEKGATTPWADRIWYLLYPLQFAIFRLFMAP